MRGLTLISRANNDSLSSLQWLINKPSIKWPNSLHGFFQMKASHSSVPLTGTFRTKRPAVSLSTCSQNAVFCSVNLQSQSWWRPVQRSLSKMPEIQNRQTNQQVSVPKMTICSTTRKPAVSSCVLWLRRSRGEMQSEALFMSWCSRLSRRPICLPSISMWQPWQVRER